MVCLPDNWGMREVNTGVKPMGNPFKFFGALVHGVSLAGKGVGKAQKILSALSADADNDGTPEYKEAIDGLVAIWKKFQNVTIPLIKNACEAAKLHCLEYKAIVSEQVVPNVKSVFEAARKAAKEEE